MPTFICMRLSPRRVIAGISFSILAVLAATGALRATLPQAGPAPVSHALTNGRIWTGNSKQPWADAVAIRENTVAAVGTSKEISSMAGPETKRTDLGGKLVIPGFNDAHIHFLSGSLLLTQVDLNGAETLEEMQRRIARYAKENPNLPWITGFGWQYSYFPEKRNPTRQDLDAVVADRPVFMDAYDGHTGWVNTKALEVAGVIRATKYEGFGELVRDANDDPTGMLKEGAQSLVTEKIPKPTREDELAALRAGLKLALSLGITSMQNAHGSEREAELYRELLDRGELPLRVKVAHSVGPRTTQADIERIRALEEKHKGPWLAMGAIKMMMDGVIETHTAAMLAPYSDGSNTSGSPAYTQEQANNVVAWADKAGLQVFIHAIGDRAVRMALDAYQNARKVNGTHDARFRIEHIETVQAADIPRFAQLGVLASMAPIHADPASIDVWEKSAGPDRSSRGFAWRALEKAGATLLYHSDWPACVSLNPIQGLHRGVNRTTHTGFPKGGWQVQQKVSMQTAVTAYTTTGAYASFEEKIKGQIAPGMLADMVVLDADLFKVKPADVHKTRVTMTIIDGKVVYP